MKKKLLATVLAMTMALTPMSVQAQEVESMRYTFTAMDNLIVTIPSSLDLTYEYGTFKGQDTVTVQGMKSDTKEYSVDISLDSTDIVYTNQTDGVSTVNGVVSLGENGTESWSADEVASGVSKDISIIVIDTLETEGTYKGAFNYNISVTKTLIDDGYFTMTANEDGTTCTITGLTDTGKAWVVANNGALPIPETRVIENKEYSVTAIGDNAFKENTDIASVTMPNTVESLGVSTFDSCSNLVSCQLSTALTTIPIYCFYACSLADITLHEGITEVQQYAFKGCPIKDLVIPESCNMLRSGSFCANNSLETIKMPVDCVFTDLTTTTETGSVKCPAFYTSCTNLKSVTLTAGQTGVSCELTDTTAKYAPWVYTSNAIDVVVDEGVTTISPRYFLGGKFKSLKIGSTVSSIGDYGCCTEICEDLYWEPESCELALSSFKNFAKSSSDATLHFGDGVRIVPKNLGYSAYPTSGEEGVKYFKHIDWGNSPSITLEAYGFQKCALQELNIPESVTDIPLRTFKLCPIKTLTLPKSLLSVGREAFCKCSSLNDIYIDAYQAVFSPSQYETYLQRVAFYDAGTDTSTVHFGSSFSENNVEAVPENLFGETKGRQAVFQTAPKIRYVDWGDWKPKSLGKAFRYSYIYELNIPDSVTSIDSGAFDETPTLSTIHLPKSVTSIADNVFKDADSTGLDTVYYAGTEEYRLANLDITNSGEAINNATWIYEDGAKDTDIFLVTYNDDNTCSIRGFSTYGKEKFKELNGELVIPNQVVKAGVAYTVTDITDSAFSSNTDITSVNLPNTLIKIGSKAFYGLAITSIDIPDSVTTIGVSCFEGCSSLASVKLSNSLTTLSNLLFKDCTSLTSIVIPNSVTGGGSTTTSGEGQQFKGCTSLTSVTLSENMINIPRAMFNGCSALSSVDLPASITEIGMYSFNETGLSYINMKKAVVKVNDYAFNGCSSLATVDYEGEYSDREAMTIGSNNNPLINAEWIYAGKRSNYDIDGLTYSVNWDDYTATCTGVSEDNASATEITIKGSFVANNVTFAVKSVGANAFSGNTNITSVVIEEGIEKLGYYAFQGCTNLQTAQLADSISDMGNATVSNATNGGTTFWNCSSLTSVNIPASLSVIPRSCFGNCSSLTSITIPDTVTEIGYQGFYSSGLTSVSIPENTIIDARAFMNCKSLKTVDMAESVYLVGTTAESDTNGKQFYGCTALTSITIPSGNPIVPGNAFLKCSALTSVTISEGVTTLGWATFAECSKMTDIYIPSTLTTVIKWCFNSDNALKTVHYNGTAESKASISVGSSGNTKFTGAAWEYAVEATTLSLRDEEPVYEIVAFDEPVQMIVTEESTLVSEPEGEITAELQADEILLVYGTVTKDGLETDWLYAENEEEYCGFIDKKFVAEYVPAPVYELVPYDEPIDMIVLDGAVLVDEPEGEVLTELEKDSILQVFGGITIDGLESEWVYTELEDETIGMIEKLYLSEEVETPTPSPSATPTPSETPTPSATPTASETPTPSETPIPSETPTPSAVPTEEPTAEPTQSPEETLIVIEDITNSQQSNESSSSEPVVLQEGGVPLNEDIDIDTSVLDYLPTEEEDLLVDQKIE